MLEEGLRGLDQRTSFRHPKGLTDVLFVIEAGNAPARVAKSITFPIPTRNGVVVVPLSFPVIYPNASAPVVNQISVNDKPLATALIADFNVMARKALKDELPGMTLRAAVRAIGKGVIQDQLNKRGGLIGIIGNIGAVVTESPADDRMWRALPERVFLARAYFPPGSYQLRVPGPSDGVIPLTIEGRYMVVPVRILQSKTYFGQTAHFGQAGTMVAEPATPPAAPVSAAARKAPAKGSVTAAGAATAEKTNAAASAKAVPIPPGTPITETASKPEAPTAKAKGSATKAPPVKKTDPAASADAPPAAAGAQK